MFKSEEKMKQNCIRNIGTRSQYFGGQHKIYGRYQWNIKYYGFKDDNEIEAAQNWAFGPYNYETGTFETINDLLGMKIEASIQGRSGGWLVVDTQLTDEQLAVMDNFVKHCLKGLPAFLEEERVFHKEMDAAAGLTDDEATLQDDLKKNEKLVQAIELIREFAGPDFVLLVKGVRVK